MDHLSRRPPGPPRPASASAPRYERATVHAILDEAYVCHLGFVVDGEPRVLPTLHARVGDTLYLHGSTGIRPAAGRPDGRPAGLRDRDAPRRPGAGPVAVPPQRQLPLGRRARRGPGWSPTTRRRSGRSPRWSSKVAHRPGRPTAARPTPRSSPRPPCWRCRCDEVSVKARDRRRHRRRGGPRPAVLGRRGAAAARPGPAEPGAGVTRARPGVSAARRERAGSPRRRCGASTSCSSRSTMSHADGLFAAIADAEVWPHLTAPTPGRPRRDGRAWSPRRCACTSTARVPVRPAGSRAPARSSAAPPTTRSTRSAARIAIGHTMLGRPRWRTGVNTESKLLLLRARVRRRSARSGSSGTPTSSTSARRPPSTGSAPQREGVLRRHRLRADGTWRDTVASR